MKRILVAVLLGVMALVVQGALATVLPPPYCPDLGLVVVIAIGLRWHGLAAGLCLAAVLGFAADVVSGTLLGQHALLRQLVFLSAFFASRQLDLRGSLPLATFVAGATFVYGLALALVSAFFIGEAPGAVWRGLGDLLPHALVNGLVGPGLLRLSAAIFAWAGDDEASPRVLRVDPRRRVV